jgi:hypothetical protein
MTFKDKQACFWLENPKKPLKINNYIDEPFVNLNGESLSNLLLDKQAHCKRFLVPSALFSIYNYKQNHNALSVDFSETFTFVNIEQ